MQNLASIQKRTSPIKFAYLAEKSEKGSISNLSTKVGLRILYRALDLRTAYTRAQKVPLSEQLGKLTKSVALRTGIFHSLCTSQPPESPIFLSTYFLLEV